MATNTVLYQANPAMFRNDPLRFVLFLCLVPLLVGIPLLLIWYLVCKCTQLTVTQDKVSLRRGILSKRLNEVRLDHVRNVQLEQRFLQRLLGVGRIGISTSGQSGVEIEVNGIPSPAKVKSIIDRRSL